MRAFDYVWLDYCCCPQASDAAEARAKAIDSLLFYVGSCTELLSLSLPDGRAPTTCASEKTYLARGWAQLEVSLARLRDIAPLVPPPRPPRPPPRALSPTSPAPTAPCPQLLGAFAPLPLLDDSGNRHPSRHHSHFASNCASVKALTVDRAGNATTRSVHAHVLRDPATCEFTFEEDRQRIGPLLHALQAMFEEAGWPFPLQEFSCAYALYAWHPSWAEASMEEEEEEQSVREESMLSLDERLGETRLSQRRSQEMGRLVLRRVSLDPTTLARSRRRSVTLCGCHRPPHPHHAFCRRLRRRQAHCLNQHLPHLHRRLQARRRPRRRRPHRQRHRARRRPWCPRRPLRRCRLPSSPRQSLRRGHY